MRRRAAAVGCTATCTYEVIGDVINLGGGHAANTRLISSDPGCPSLPGITRIRYKEQGVVKTAQDWGNVQVPGDIYNTCHGVYGGWVAALDYSVNTDQFHASTTCSF